MIRFQCPNCNTVLQIGSEYAGQPVLCSSCNTQLIVPQMPVPEPTLDKADRSVIICICGQCKSTFKVPASSAGRQVPCPKCGRAAQIPEQEKVITDTNTLKFACPACWQYYCVMAKYAGKKFKCLVCKQPCIIPQPASPPQDLVLLEEDNSPSPPPQPQAQAGQELSFKLLAEEEPQPPTWQPQLPGASPGPPPIPEESVQPPAARPSRSGRKAPGSPFKLVAGIIAGIIGFVAGFAVVYMLVKPKSPDVQTEQVQTAEPSGTDEQTPEKPQAPTGPQDRTDKPISSIRQMPAESQSQPAPQAAPPAFQKEEILAFATGTAQYLNPKVDDPWDYPDLKYQFPDDVTVTDADMQALEKAMDVGFFEEANSTIESARMEIGASWYLVRTSIKSNTGANREMFMAIFEIEEESEEEFTETVHWVFAITIRDEKGTVLASVGQQDPNKLIAQMDPLVDEHSTGVTVEQVEELAGIAKTIGALMCPILIVMLIVGLITLIAQISIVINAGEPAWALFVPVYRQVILCRVAEKPEWMGWICGLAEGILYYPEFLTFVHPMVFIIAPIVYIVFNFIFSLGIAKAHGRSVGFGLGLFFLPIIFYPILAFSGKAYTD